MPGKIEKLIIQFVFTTSTRFVEFVQFLSSLNAGLCYFVDLLVETLNSNVI